MTEEQKVYKEYKDNNVVFIGDKPLINYATSVVMNFTTKNVNNVIIKSRGKFISKAVDVSQVAINRFLKDQVELGDVKIGSEEFVNKEGRNVRVSFVEITIKKKI